MENFAFTPTTEAPALENNKAKQEIVENLSLVLEACSKNNEEIHVVEEAISAPLEKLSKLYDTVTNKYKALLGVLVFVAVSQASFDSVQTDKEAPLHEDSLEQAAEKRDEMKKIAGFDVVQEAEKVGRKVAFYIPEKHCTLTVIHLGQVHHVTSQQEESYKSRDKISKSQNEIASFLTKNTTPDTHVFIEGNPEKHRSVFSSEKESSLAGAAEIMGAKGQIHVEYAETGEGNRNAFKALERLVKKGEVFRRLILSLNQDSDYSRKITGGLKRYFSAKQIQIISQDDRCVKNIECQKLVKELIEVDIPSVEKSIMDDREDIAVELIAKQAKTSTQNVFPLVYGRAHDFTRAILKWNKAHPEEQFNLVTVK